MCTRSVAVHSVDAYRTIQNVKRKSQPQQQRDRNPKLPNEVDKNKTITWWASRRRLKRRRYRCKVYNIIMLQLNPK